MESSVCGNFAILLFPTESLSSPGLPTWLAGHTPWQGDVQNATALADKAAGNEARHFSLSTSIFQPWLLEMQHPEVFPDSSGYTELLIRSRQEGQNAHLLWKPWNTSWEAAPTSSPVSYSHSPITMSRCLSILPKYLLTWINRWQVFWHLEKHC